MSNPWDAFAEKHPVGSNIEGEIKNITEFGLFIGLDGGVDGMVHLSDLDWNKPGEQAITEYQKGQVVQAQVLDIDVEKERISLGIKRLANDPFQSLGDLKKGSVVTCTVAAVDPRGLTVSVGDGVQGYIRKVELSRDRDEQRPERFSVGDKLDATIVTIDGRARKQIGRAHV